MNLFETTFLDAQRKLGLAHYSVTFCDVALPGLYAEIDADPGDCIATVRYDSASCSGDDATEDTAIHEAIHLLLADFKHAMEGRSRAAQRVEEERVVRRVEAIVMRGLRAE
jgi:hypothetical protein